MIRTIMFRLEAIAVSGSSFEQSPECEGKMQRDQHAAKMASRYQMLSIYLDTDNILIIMSKY